jgi:hypothetical protein
MRLMIPILRRCKSNERRLMRSNGKPQAKLSSRNYVKRDNVFKRASKVDMIPGEALYRRYLNSTPPKYIRY